MRKFFIISLLLGILSGLYMQGTFLHFLIAAGYLIYFALPLGFLLLFWWAMECHLIRVVEQATTWSIPFQYTRGIFLTVTCSVILSMTVGIGTYKLMVANTRAFVNQTVPKLDDYREQYGRFPESLSELENVHSPYFSADEFSYTGYPQEFIFRYNCSDMMMSSYSFNSIDRQWTFHDF